MASSAAWRSGRMDGGGDAAAAGDEDGGGGNTILPEEQEVVLQASDCNERVEIASWASEREGGSKDPRGDV